MKAEGVAATVVVGGGAIGLLVAGRFALAGLPVALLARPGSVQALSAEPLQLIHEGASSPVPRFPVAATPAALPPAFHAPALAVLCVKGYDTAGALPTLQALAPRCTLTLQNGIGHEETLAAALGPEAVIAGAITTSVEPESASRIVVTKWGGVGLASLQPASALEPWLALFTQAGFVTRAYPDYHALKWSKALLNMLGNASAAILAMPVDAVYADRRLIELERRAFREALAVMDRMRWRVVDLPRYPAALLARAMRWLPALLLYPLLRKRVAGGRGGKDPSLLRDLRAGRARSEGEYIYGAIAQQAAACTVAAPVNAALWRVLAAIASGNRPWDEFRGQPKRLLAEVRSDSR